jgi:hypothetical protein
MIEQTLTVKQLLVHERQVHGMLQAACIGTAWQRNLSTAQRELGTAIYSEANCRRTKSIRDALAVHELSHKCK